VSELGVFLGGEGPNELGSRSGDAPYQTDAVPGVLQALLRLVQPAGWRVVGAKNWAQIRKLKARGPSPNEAQNVRALALDAKEAGAAILAFIRDSDGHDERIQDIDTGIAQAKRSDPDLELIGGVAHPVLEAWLLAMQGERGTERLSKSAAQASYGVKTGALKNTEKAVEIVEACVPQSVPQDARTLHGWLNTASEVFARRIR